MSKARKIINNSLAQFWRNHSNGICKQQVTMELCARQQHRVTMTQPLQWDLQAVRRKRPKNYARNSDAEQHWCSPSTAICKHQSAEASRINYVGKTEAPGQDLLQNWILAPKAEKSAILKPFEKGHLEGKRKAPKTKKTVIKLQLQLAKMKLSCETSKSESWRCENEAFVRNFPQKLNCEDVKPKLSWETSLKSWKLKLWKRSFRARLPLKNESWRCENEALVWDFPQKLKVEVIENEAFVEDFPQKLKVEIAVTTIAVTLVTRCCDNHCCDTHCCAAVTVSNSLQWQPLHWHSLQGKSQEDQKKILLGTKNTPRESKIKYYWDQKTCWPASTPKPTPPTKFNFP